jgi:hypothetical protein
MSNIIKRLDAATMVEVLSSKFSGSDLQSILIEVQRRRVASLSPSDVLRSYESNRFVSPSSLDPSVFAEFDRLVWSQLGGTYEGMTLSPLCPLGTNSVVATVDQNKIVSTVRSSEVVADTTNVLALECAVRRKQLLRERESRLRPVYLAASQRQVRAQQFDTPGALAHFGLLGLCAAGRDEGSFTFQANALITHIASLLNLIHTSRPDFEITLALTELNTRVTDLELIVLEPLKERFPTCSFVIDPERSAGRGYYIDACFKIIATYDGVEFEIGDGGCVDWTAQYLSDSKERLVIAGIGIDRVIS